MNDDTTPSGIDTVEITMELSKMKAAKYVFGYYESDDISQEIWLSVNKAAEKYNSDKLKKGKRPLSFFNVASENALKNLKRDNKIIDNVHLGNTPVNQVDYNLMSEMRAKELREFITNRLPPKLVDKFNELVDYGDECVSQYQKRKIRDAVLQILKEYREE